MTENCPKCHSPAVGPSCPRCGLDFSRFDPAAVKNAGVPESLAALWTHAQENWTDRARHALFVETAIGANQAGYAAACYRKKGDDPVAQEQLDRLTSRLLQNLTATREQNPPSPRGKTAMMLLAVFVILVIIGAILIHATSIR